MQWKTVLRECEENNSSIRCKSITGTYRVQSGDKFIAFDATKDKEKYIYRGDTKYLYTFDSGLYDIVIKACN